ncbi:MAG: FapA family protein [Oscillospiraceae bacterium]|nr:FapA family protein [Oscillospiraceae bacterium]
MALNAFFARLFGSNAKDGGDEDEEEKEEELVEEKPEDVPSGPSEEDILATELHLPSDNALLNLWELHKMQSGWIPVPMLRLTGPPDDLLIVPPEKLGQELQRLQTALTASANQRIKQTVPKSEEDPVPDTDALPTVFMTGDQMAAWIFIYPPTGEGKHVDREMINKVLSENNINFGIDEASLNEIPEEHDRYFRLIFAAKGQAPQHGKDGNIVDLFSRKVEREVAVDEFNQVDYTSLNLVQNVEQGATICHIILPTEGTPGKTVQSKEVSAKNGRSAFVPKGRNTEVSEDGTKLVATRAGHVEFSGRTFQVKPLLDIKGNVDYSVGNINFLGDVHIHGDVCSGFNVRATGSITVDGVVEASNLEAGGDLVMAKGVLGNNQAVITAHRTIYAKYLENCRVHAREDLQTDCIVNCDVYSDGSVTVRSGRGTIIGGCVRAANQVSASVVGSRAERLTVIVLGGQPCEDLEKEMLRQEIREMEEEFEKTERQPNSPAKVSRLSTLRMKLSVNRQKLDQFEREASQLLMVPPEEIHNMRLTCGVLYAGTEVRIGMAKMKVKDETRQCTVRLIDGQVCFV